MVRQAITLYPKKYKDTGIKSSYQGAIYGVLSQVANLLLNVI